MRKFAERHDKGLNRIIMMILVLASISEAATSLGGTPGAPSWLEMTDIDRVIYVDQNHPQSSDINFGSLDSPLKTINAAAQLAIRNHKRGFSTKVLVSAGVYREQIKMDFTQREKDPVIIFKSIEAGEVIISGADVWTDWEKFEGRGIYVHAWPYKWGLVPYPPKWEGQVKLENIVLRKEMVTVAGLVMSQVLSFTELAEGSFFISEEENLIFLYPPKNRKEDTLSAEVAVRSNLFQVKGKKGIVLKGLTFQYDASGIQGAAVWFVDSSDILVEDCEFRFNNWTGFSLHNVHHVTTRRNKALENGGAGMVIWKNKFYLSEDDETSRNNRRGLKGNFLYWAVGGLKVMRTHEAIFRRHKANKNHTGGLWFDSDNSNILIEDSLWCGNLKHGLFIEASQGPFTIRKNVIVKNGELGVRILFGQNIFFEKNVIVDNVGPQIQIRGKGHLMIDDWETREEILLKIAGYEFKGNIIEGEDAVIDVESSKDFFSSLHSHNNWWFKPGGRGPFKIGTDQLSFKEWKIRTIQDLNSKFGEVYDHSSYSEKDCHYTIE